MKYRVFIVVYSKGLETERKEFEVYINAKMFAQDRAIEGYTNIVVAEVIERAVCRKMVEWEKP